MKTSPKNIRNYMVENVTDHVDWMTREVNYTLLAEDACSHFGDYEPDDSIDQMYYDIAIEVGTEWENKNQLR